MESILLSDGATGRGRSALVLASLCGTAVSVLDTQYVPLVPCPSPTNKNTAVSGQRSAAPAVHLPQRQALLPAPGPAPLHLHSVTLLLAATSHCKQVPLCSFSPKSSGRRCAQREPERITAVSTFALCPFLCTLHGGRHSVRIISK